VAWHGQLDASGCAEPLEVKAYHPVLQIIMLLGSPLAVPAADEEQRLQSIRKLYEQQKWEEILRQAQGPAEQSADFDYYAGMAFSHLDRWGEARDAFSNGVRKVPRDARFLTERAGAEYKLNNFSAAKRDLRRSMRLDPSDSYVAEFLGTIYLLEGNLEAALKYWNPINKPRLAAVDAVPAPKTRKALLDRAVLFSPPAVLSADSFLQSSALLENLGTFPNRRVELSPATSSSNSDDYKATLRLTERNGWGLSLLDGAISLLRGLPYETLYPSYYNLRGDAISLDSLARWDSQKRRVAASVEFPLFQRPDKRLRVFVDARNENWNLSQTFSGSAMPITNLNLKRFAGGAELHLIETARWDLTAGLKAISREFRNVPASLRGVAAPFFTDSRTLDTWLGAHRALLRVPERRLTLDGQAEVSAGRNYGSGLGAFASVNGELKSRWLPKARGDDYEFLSRLRGGDTFGDVPLDGLYQLGVEHDNDLWLRGHPGTLDGRKGRAPLGRRYLLLTSELYKTVYDGAFFRVQLGPFFDTGAIADPSGLFGSQKWLFDTGIQARVRVLGSVSVLLSYGRDLRSGAGTFYATSVH
jgi:tetratricopeptide (TPR) repeat protein